MMTTGAQLKLGAMTVSLAVIGGVMLAGTGTLAAVDSITRLTTAASGTSHVLTDVQGLDLDVEVSRGDLRVLFHEGAEVRLESDGDTSGWTLRRDEDSVMLRSPDSNGTWWWDRIFDMRDGGPSVTLLLPRSMAGLDADLTLNAGRLRADGEFGELDAVVNAGELQVSGAARQADLSVNAGSATVDLDALRELSLELAAGEITARSRTAPEWTTIEVAAGRIVLTVPSTAEYSVQRDATLGTVNGTLPGGPGSPHRVDVRVAAGTVDLRTAD